MLFATCMLEARMVAFDTQEVQAACKEMATLPPPTFEPFATSPSALSRVKVRFAECWK